MQIIAPEETFAFMHMFCLPPGLAALPLAVLYMDTGLRRKVALVFIFTSNCTFTRHVVCVCLILRIFCHFAVKQF